MSDPLQQLVDQIVSNASGGMVYVSADGSLARVNEAAAGILGTTMGEMSQRTLIDYGPETIWPDRSPCPPEEYPASKAIATGAIQSPVTIGVRTPGGEVAWILVGAVPVREADGGVRGVLVQFESIAQPYKESPIPAFVWKQEGEDFSLIDYNEAGAGFSQGVELLIGAKLSESYADMPDVSRDMTFCAENGQIIRREMSYRFRTRPEVVPIAVTYAFAPPDMVVVYVEDRSAEVKARERLEDVERELQSAEAEQRRRQAGERQRLARAVIAAQDAERGRVARELHDGIAQRLTSAALALDSVELPPEATDSEGFAVARQLVEEALDDVRRLAVGLHPRALEKLGLARAAAELVEGWSAATGVAAELESVGFDADRLERPVEVVLYRGLQECLANVQRHADAGRVNVLLRRDATSATLVVEDDGRGAEGREAGLGHLNLEERARLLDGRVTFESPPDGGFIVYTTIPLAPDQG